MSSTLLRLEGRDALELLHRISTQFLSDLAPGQARFTLFCDFRGRLEHRALVAVTADRAVWLLRDDAPAGPLAAYVERYIFREDVRMAEETGRRLWRAIGASPDAAGLVREENGVPRI